jgi:hypothetical protein
LDADAGDCWRNSDAEQAIAVAEHGPDVVSNHKSSSTAVSLTLRSICASRRVNTAQRPLSRGFSPSGCPAEPLVSYRINRQLSGWNPAPLVIRAFGAHCQPQTFDIYSAAKDQWSCGNDQCRRCFLHEAVHRRERSGGFTARATAASIRLPQKRERSLKLFRESSRHAG